MRSPQTSSTPTIGNTWSASRHSRRRTAVIMLELILALPVILIFLLAIVEFGLILALSKHVSYASRFAATIAADEARSNVNGVGDVNLPAGGSDLLTAVNQYLATAGITGGACQVILQHNVSGIANQTQIDGPGGCNRCTAPATDLPAAPLVCPGVTLESVRVTVCVPLEGNVPNLLCTFGFSNEDCVMRETTTYRFKDCPLP
jgi:hypothetical protein